MTPAPRAARSRLTRVATFCSAAAGGWASQRTSTIRSTGMSVGLSTASSFSSVRDLRLPTCSSGSSIPSRATPNSPARRSSTCRDAALPALGPRRAWVRSPPRHAFTPHLGMAGYSSANDIVNMLTLISDWRAGELRRDHGALTGGGPDLEAPAEGSEPVGHVPLAGAQRGVSCIVADAVVGHGEPQGPVL